MGPDIIIPLKTNKNNNLFAVAFDHDSSMNRNASLNSNSNEPLNPKQNNFSNDNMNDHSNNNNNNNNNHSYNNNDNNNNELTDADIQAQIAMIEAKSNMISYLPNMPINDTQNNTAQIQQQSQLLNNKNDNKSQFIDDSDTSDDSDGSYRKNRGNTKGGPTPQGPQFADPVLCCVVFPQKKTTKIIFLFCLFLFFCVKFASFFF